MRCHDRFMLKGRLPNVAKPSRAAAPSQVAARSGVVAGGVLLLAGLCFISGCVSGIEATFAPYVECKRRAIITLRAQAEAKQIWEACYEDQHPDSNAADAEHGFITGYTETALGFVNSPPPVPARPCFSIHTLTHGYPDAGAWYSGYHQGTAAALAKGVDRWRLAPIDPGLLHPACETEIASDSLSNLPPLQQPVVEPVNQRLAEPPKGPLDESLKQPWDLQLQSPSGGMIDQDIYRDQERATESPSDLPAPKSPQALPQPNNEIIMTPKEAELIRKLIQE